MVRLTPALLCVGLVLVQLVAAAAWPTTLLEHTALASGAFAPTPRTRLEKLALTQVPAVPAHLATQNDRLATFGADALGALGDAPGLQQENNGRSREPSSAHFDGATPQTAGALSDLPLPPPQPKSDRRPCSKRQPCKKKKKQPPAPLPPVVVPPPVVEPPRVIPPPIPPTPELPSFPEPPTKELPPASPPRPGCKGLCNVRDTDPHMVRVPSPPLADEPLAITGAEGEVLKSIKSKLKNRAGWMQAQAAWLLKATEAAGVVRREIELAESTRASVASDIEQLQLAQDHLSVRLKANQLKWAFKDKKVTLEHAREGLEHLEIAKRDTLDAMKAAQDEIKVLTATLGPVSEQRRMTPEELAEPLKFLEDIEPEDEFKV